MTGHEVNRYVGKQRRGFRDGRRIGHLRRWKIIGRPDTRQPQPARQLVGGPTAEKRAVHVVEFCRFDKVAHTLERRAHGLERACQSAKARVERGSHIR